MPLTLNAIAHSETGLVRKSNQDSGYVSQSMLLVADGMGGAAAGDLASAVAARELQHVANVEVSGSAARLALRESIVQANEHIERLVGANPDLDGMGTTVCGALFDGQCISVVHIGDSRGYLYSHNTLHRLTHDHSYVQSLIDEGRLDERAAMSHPHRSLLLRVLNGSPEVMADYFSLPLAEGDRLMFCSDGLCGLAPDDAIAAAMRLPEPDEAMSTLINLAHAAGATDNITIILADVVASAAPAPGEDEEGTVVLAKLPPRTHHRSAYVRRGLIGAAADPRVVSLLEALEPPAEEGESSTATIQPLTPAQEEHRRYAPSSKKSHKAFILIIVAVVLALAGTAGGIAYYGSHQFYIGESDGRVAIYQGLPGSIAGIPTSRVYETTTIKLDNLPISWRDRVTTTISASSGGLDQARTTVEQLQTKSDQCLAARATRPPGTPAPSDGC
ncbi:MAG: protein phosphatase 2C domain-containing protein [Propionibacteriaceae bacterium]|nr:protein phosphatase 2C domain-containing protein [Propionibacteriaceae bacterium]